MLKNNHLAIPGRRDGPYCFSPSQTGVVYRDFLPNFLPELLQDVVLQPRIHLWFMHDGSAPHFFFHFGNS